MTQYREILRLHNQGISISSIASCCECSRNTVKNVLQKAGEIGMQWPLSADVTDEKIRRLLFPMSIPEGNRKQPDYEYIHKEMAKSGVTLSLLWNEYCEQCRQTDCMPFMYTQYCKHYREYAAQTKATMHIAHKPGETMQVDWAGQTAYIIDRDTGEIIPAYIFVAALPCSGYAYCEGFLSQDQESWTAAHVNAYRFFGGVTRILVPDNLKTGVEKPSWYSPVINRTYHELAEHYGTAVIPTRVRAPKDKASVEGTVGAVSTWIIAALRNAQFFSVSELNATVREKLETFNTRPFQKKAGNRQSVFLEEEKDFLLPLPEKPYELAIWRTAAVAFNYCIQVDRNFYSVPYAYIKQRVDVRVTRSALEVFFQGSRICSHPRITGKSGQYSIMTEHMPDGHKQYLEWNGERFIAWASKIGHCTEVVVRGILSSFSVEQRGYRPCMALLKLGDKYSVSRLEAACQRALTYTPRPGFKSIQSILATGQDKLRQDDSPEQKQTDDHGFTRGSSYYGRDE